MILSWLVSSFANLIMPVFILVVLCAGYWGKINVFETFIEGAKEGIEITFKILPYLVAMFLAIGLMNSSGLLEIITFLLKPVTRVLSFPPEVLPLVIIKPFSGSGYLAVLSDIFKENGTDTFIGMFASILAGSTETIFYVLTVYFGVVGIKDMRHALAAAVTTEVLAIFISFIVAGLLF